MKPICFKCHRFYRPKKNGFIFLEGMPTHPDAKSGLEEPEAWTDYKLWSGDLWQCPGCRHQLISGVAITPISEVHRSDFAKLKEKFAVSYRVNDC